jgi:hypothetical protein
MASSQLPPIPSVARYKAAFRAVDQLLNDGQRAMLRGQYLAPDRTMTATELATVAGYRATYFLRKVQELGGVEAARRLISQDTVWPSCTTARGGILRLPSLCGDVPDDEPCFAAIPAVPVMRASRHAGGLV